MMAARKNYRLAGLFPWFGKRTPGHFQCRRSCEMQCQKQAPGPPNAQSSRKDPCS